VQNAVVHLFNFVRATAATSVLLLALSSGSATAATIGDLYQTSTLVTGQGEANRALGYGRCLRDVLLKVSGDLRLLDDPRLDALEQDAASFVRDFRYRDLLAGIPIHDEQGSRDRPYELTADFDAGKIDNALRALGRQPWTAERPRVVVFISVRKEAESYLMASDGDRGIDEREALAAAAKTRGLKVSLPTRASLAEADVTMETLFRDDGRSLEAAVQQAGGEVALSGRIVWDELAPGWIADWRLISAGITYQWRTRIATFDATFRSALGGAAQILAGYGSPR
jgi:uncharacterized protein